MSNGANRVRSGRPAGGQFTPTSRPESDVALDDDASTTASPQAIRDAYLRGSPADTARFDQVSDAAIADFCQRHLPAALPSPTTDGEARDDALASIARALLRSRFGPSETYRSGSLRGFAGLEGSPPLDCAPDESDDYWEGHEAGRAMLRPGDDDTIDLRSAAAREHLEGLHETDRSAWCPECARLANPVARR